MKKIYLVYTGDIDSSSIVYTASTKESADAFCERFFEKDEKTHWVVEKIIDEDFPEDVCFSVEVDKCVEPENVRYRVEVNLKPVNGDEYNYICKPSMRFYGYFMKIYLKAHDVCAARENAKAIYSRIWEKRDDELSALFSEDKDEYVYYNYESGELEIVE